MVEKISTLGLQLVSASNLTGGQVLLSKLSQQLTTGVYSSNLSDYRSSEAQKVLNFNSKIGEQKGFLTVIGTITPRIKTYDASLTGIEDTAGDAYSTLLSSSTYNEDTVSALQSAISGYMDDMAYYLNQKVGDRYIFSGTRYTQEPVLSGDALQTLLKTTPTSTTLVSPPAVPEYDTSYDPTTPGTAATATVADGMEFTAAAVGVSSNDITISFSADTANPGMYVATIEDPSTGTTEVYDNLDPATFWADLETAIGGLPSTLVTGTVSGGTADVTTLTGNTYTLSGGVDPTSADEPYPEAWVRDSVKIDTTKDLSYGVSSNDEGFQQIILGLRYAYAATANPDQYSEYMETALTLLSSGLSGVRATHTTVTNAYSSLEKTSDIIKTKVTNLEDQISDIESVDVNEVGVKITVLQAMLEASYSVTAQTIQLSLLNYL